MKLVTFTHQQQTRIGVVVGEDVVDLAAAAPELPRDMIAFLAAGEDALAVARKAADSGSVRIPLTGAKLEAPVPRPPEFLAIGLNYADHIEESGMKKPDFPMFFNKQSIFDCFAQIETLSTVMTLEPGTVVATGTPGGVGIAMRPPKFLVVDDVVRIEIEGIGWIENRVIEEPAS